MAESSEEFMNGEESVHENNTTLDKSSMILDDSERNEAETSLEGLESLAVCECRSQCTRKLKTSAKGKVTGCPCKGYGLKCGQSCNCGTNNKPCKNKANAQDNNTRVQVESQTQSSANEPTVEELLGGLTSDQVLEVARRGFQSRRLELLDLISSLGSEQDCAEPLLIVPSYCTCGYCGTMPTTKEDLCCKQRKKCRTKSLAFHNICIESENLCTTLRKMADTYVFTPTYDNRAMRHAAYRQYIMWQHGHLGKGHRKVITSCCVWEIRKYYPSPNRQYTGYK